MTGISRIPAGLIGYLGIKNFGKYPQALTEELVGTWDLSGMYLNYDAQWLEVVAAIGLGYNVTFSANPGEVRIIHDASVAYTTGAAEAASIGLMRSAPNNIAPVNVTNLVTAGASTGVVSALERPLILPPGDNFGVFCTNLVGAQNFYFRVRYTVLVM